jgi:hypothetical protein
MMAVAMLWKTGEGEHYIQNVRGNPDYNGDGAASSDESEDEYD